MLLALSLASCSSNEGAKHEINSPLVDFGIAELNAAIQLVQAAPPSLRMVIDTTMEPQAYACTFKNRRRINLLGGDESGLMYALLDMAAQIRHGGSLDSLTESSGTPFIGKRGLKFNIPLDARTPSFDDTGDAAQNNIKTVWEFAFWEDFLDDMARYRYNTLTLWTPNPFPTMIEIPGMEGASLEDVCISTLELSGEHGEWAEPTMVSREVLEHVEIIKTMSIHEKISFWQKVMRHAKNRGIDIYFITWNIAPNAVANPVDAFYKCWLWKEPLEEDPGKYGVSHDIFNRNTIEYYRKAVKTFIATYPDLKGIGVTSGEHMPRWLDDVEREKWLWSTYGMGLIDALEEDPDREVDFIHRMWWTNMDNVMQYWGNYPGKFDLSFKYSRARLYSNPKPVYANELLPILEDYGLLSWWNLRNDDIFLHRWGDPDYVRTLMLNFPHERTAGYHMGSDGYVWGRNSSDMINPGQLEIRKHWYKFLLWGMLGYDPGMDDAFFIDAINQRLPGPDAAKLFSTWQSASKIIPLVNTFHFVDWDFQWSVEGCFGQGVEEVYSPSDGFHSVADFIHTRTMDGMNMLNPKDFVNAYLAGTLSNETTPTEISDSLESLALFCLGSIEEMGLEEMDEESAGRSEVELNETMKDILSMSYLGLYYAEKIRGSVALEFFMRTGIVQHQQLATSHMENALKHWGDYAEINRERYSPQVLARPGLLDLDASLDFVREDISIVKDATPLI